MANYNHCIAPKLLSQRVTAKRTGGGVFCQNPLRCCVLTFFARHDNTYMSHKLQHDVAAAACAKHVTLLWLVVHTDEAQRFGQSSNLAIWNLTI